MPGEFVPLFQPAGAVQPLPAQTPAFTPVMHSPAAPAAQPSPLQASQPSHSPRDLNIEIRRDGDRVSQIRIQCRCGELIELDCEY